LSYGIFLVPKSGQPESTFHKNTYTNKVLQNTGQPPFNSSSLQPAR
jgi:hypothetical protein